MHEDWDLRANKERVELVSSRPEGKEVRSMIMGYDLHFPLAFKRYPVEEIRLRYIWRRFGYDFEYCTV